jgi:transposase-like protein
MKKSNKKISTNSEKKRTYNKYSYALKRKIVNDILKGILSKEEAMLRYGIRSRQSINYWLSKFGLLNYRHQKNYGMKQSPEEKIKELQARIEELENAKIVLNMAIDIADEQFGTQIRKKFLPQSLAAAKKHKTIKSKN